MKRLFLIALLLLIPLQAHALLPVLGVDGDEDYVAASGGSSCSGACCDSFARADSANVTTGAPITWTETDANGKLSISSNYLSFSADTANQVGYVTATTSCFASAQGTVTMHFTVKMPSTFTAISTANKTATIAKLKNGANNVATFDFVTDGSGNLTTLRGARYASGAFQENSANATISGLTPGAEYAAYLYFKSDATNGTVALKIGSLAEVNTGLNDTSADTINTVQIGGISSTLGDGTNDIIINLKNLQVDLSDTR